MEPVEKRARVSAKLWAGTRGRSFSLAVREVNGASLSHLHRVTNMPCDHYQMLTVQTARQTSFDSEGTQGTF